jgi:hypothetical protein
VTPERQELIRNSVPVTINGHSERELDYREKAVMAIMKKWNGFLDPQLNNPKLRAQLSSIRCGYRRSRSAATGDFMVSIQGAMARLRCRLRTASGDQRF